MKKFLILLLLSCVGNSWLKAQLVLTQANNEPVAGHTVAFLRYDSVAPLPRNTGVNQSWDFSAMVTNTLTTFNYTSTYVPVSSVPASSLFSGANLVSKAGINEYVFYKSTNSLTPQLEMIGRFLGSWRIDSIKNTKIEKTWPIAYGYSSTDTYSGNMVGGSLVAQIDGTVSTAAVGSGTMILPGGYQLNNILMVKTTNYSVEAVTSPTPASSSIFTATTYDFYHAISRFPIVTILDQKSNMTAVVPDYTWVYYSQPLTLDILERSSRFSFEIYPNPASQKFSIRLSNNKHENCTAQIYDAVGKIVSVKDFGNVPLIKEDISISGLPGGVYFLKIQLGDKASFRKLIVE